MDIFASLVKKCVRELFDVETKFDFSHTDEKFGDYATNVAMILAGQAKKSDEFRQKIARKYSENFAKSPRSFAEKIAEKLRESGEFDSVEIAGPGFLNLRTSAENLAQNLQNQFDSTEKSDLKFGETRANSGKIAVVEYPSPNVAKPYSVGHLRSGDQGWAAKNLLESQGWKVITDNHLGDSGSPFGYWVLGYKMFSSPEKLADGGVYELGRVYIKIREELKNEAARGEHTLADEAQDWLLKLESKDPEAVKFSDDFSQISLAHIHKVMARLGISTEYEYGEKFFAPLGKKAVAKLLDEKIATKNDDGSVIVDLESQGVKTPLLIQKSNGANLYATGDLACMLWREENWRPDLTVYCVGAEQKFYFEQLKALAKILGLKQDIYHLSYGMIDQLSAEGTREKMSSRKGVVLMEELLDFAFSKAKDSAKSDDMSDADLRKISVGAIKFRDFASDRSTGMLFDWDEMFSVTGFSGPYVQYAAVRVNKILRDNAAADELIATDYDYVAEKNLILKLLDFPGVLLAATDELKPHKIAAYAFELAKELNKYYEKTPVATKDVAPEIRAIRLGLLRKISLVFAQSLGILGIEIPEKM